MNFAVFFLAAFGLSFVIGYSKITYWFRLRLARSGEAGRWLVALMECPGCLGWWTGLFGAGIIHAKSRFLLAFATVGANLLLAHIAGLDREAQ